MNVRQGAERHQLGQWYTPDSVAALALSLAMPVRTAGARVLDPSCGDGVFLRAAQQRGVPSQQISGVDVDSKAIAAARVHTPNVSLHLGDFFQMPHRAQDLGAFEVIVGNPPYVRQERLDSASKQERIDCLARDWPTLPVASIAKLVRGGDMAAPFVLHALASLKTGGRAAMVLSSAFLDSGYGVLFWELLSEVASVTLLLDAPEERWFADASVHSLIAVFSSEPQDGDVSIGRLRMSSANAAQVIAGGGQLQDVATVRRAQRNAPHTWAAALRAPATWFQFAALAGRALVPLGELADLRRGITSGANDVFYLTAGQGAEYGIPQSLLMPLLRASKVGRTIAVDVREMPDRVLAIPASAALPPEVKRYLGTFPDAPQRRTLATRHPWWSLPTQTPTQVFLRKAYSETFVQPYCREPILADQRIYSVYPRPGVSAQILSAVLNASTTALALESLGRASMGQGALEWSVADARKLPVLNPLLLSGDCQSALVQSFASLSHRPILKVDREILESDRREHDRILLRGFPQLAGLEPVEVQQALVDSCKTRQLRSQL